MTRSVRWVLGGLVALLVAWLLAPAAVPLYDGPGFPDEPYRYVKPPAGAKPTKPPTVARTTLGVNAAGVNAAGYSNSGEQGPQVVLYVPSGALKAPPGTRSIAVAETPLAPEPPLPRDGVIVTNVYRVTATAPGGGAVRLVGTGATGAPSLQMRAPNANQPGPVFEHRDGSRWTQTQTIRVGQDIYQTAPGQFALGDWALVKLAHSGSKSGGINGGLLALGIGVLVIAGIIVGIRIARTRRAG